MKSKLPWVQNTNFKDSIVLITGAGGTIGTALINSIQAKLIIALDISEYAMYRLRRQTTGRSIQYIVGDASDARVIRMLFNKYSIDHVFNAAAYKHVDALESEDNTYSVVKNNICTVINLCNHLHNVKTFVHISSDKAVYPTNSMGYTKLWCERVVQSMAAQSPASCKIVRFGNVYRSSGSFVETLEWQLEQDLPITVTDDKMKRYFMTVEDAVMLINHVVDMPSGYTYILEMGEEIAITDLVDQLNYKNLPITYIGIRPGEKLSEQLTYDYEQTQPTHNPLIYQVGWFPVNSMTQLINQLQQELDKDEICTKQLNEIIATTTIL